MRQPFQYSAYEIQFKHHRFTLDFRSQDRLIQSEVFAEAWNRADEDKRKYVLNLLSKPDPYKLKRWILSIMVGGLDQYPIKILRQIASYNQIKNYSRMTKTQLLSILNKKGVTNGCENS